jgi:hypothetical protein
LVHVVQAWAANLNKKILPALGCKNLIVHASGPLTERVRTPWRRSQPGLEMKFAAAADESLLMAAGAALEALSVAGRFPALARPMDLRPELSFRQYARPQPAPLTELT